MKYFHLTAVIAAFVISISCSRDADEKAFCINGVWEMRQITFHDGEVLTYTDNGMLWMRIYDDSCYYSCQTQKAPNGTLIDPANYETYTYIERGKNNILYLQGNNNHPLHIVNDSTMIIQEDGIKYTWKRNKDFDKERSLAVIDIIRNDNDNPQGASHRYVYSKAERKLETTNHALIYILIIAGMVLLLIMNYACSLYRNKKRVEMELKHLEEEHKAMPEPVRQALNTVETAFHRSDFYISLRKRISNGEKLHKEDWESLESHLNSVYPRFTSTLLSLYNMSQVEYHVCLLLKLNAAPSEIANVLCKDTSSISSTRSRLYQKVFGKKGSSKDWDDFIIHNL